MRRLKIHLRRLLWKLFGPHELKAWASRDVMLQDQFDAALANDNPEEALRLKDEIMANWHRYHDAK